MTSNAPGRLRIVVAEPTLARALRDAGHEVILLGPDPTPEQLVATAVQEDADLVGLAAGSDDSLEAPLRALLDAAGLDDVDLSVLTPAQARAAL